MLRGWLKTSLQPECDRMMGASERAIIWSRAWSLAWLASITMPSRFASATKVRPAEDSPPHSGASVAESARSLLRKWTGPIIRTPRSWKVFISVRSPATGEPFSMLMKTKRFLRARMAAASSAARASSNCAPCRATISRISMARNTAWSRAAALPAAPLGPWGVKTAKKPPSTPPSIIRGRSTWLSSSTRSWRSRMLQPGRPRFAGVSKWVSRTTAASCMRRASGAAAAGRARRSAAKAVARAVGDLSGTMETPGGATP